uniref:Putative ovule protein n=1 Tax=Solanum chacoense TaxID=4108 RepID=A0A0V0GXA3_SOLCH
MFRAVKYKYGRERTFFAFAHLFICFGYGDPHGILEVNFSVVPCQKECCFSFSQFLSTTNL